MDDGKNVTKTAVISVTIPPRDLSRNKSLDFTIGETGNQC